MRTRPTRPGPSHRLDRVSTQIQHSLAEALATEVKDPRVGFVTVTNVQMTADLAFATVWVSVLGTEEEKSEALAGLRSASGFLRSMLARRSRLRTVPELRFILDRAIERAARIDELLREDEAKGAP